MCIAQIHLDYIISYLFSIYCKILIFFRKNLQGRLRLRPTVASQLNVFLQIKFGSNLFKGLWGAGAKPRRSYKSNFRSFSLIRPFLRIGYAMMGVSTAGSTKQISKSPIQSMDVMPAFVPATISFSQPVYTPI